MSDGNVSFDDWQYMRICHWKCGPERLLSTTSARFMIWLKVITNPKTRVYNGRFPGTVDEGGQLSIKVRKSRILLKKSKFEKHDFFCKNYFPLGWHPFSPYTPTWTPYRNIRDYSLSPQVCLGKTRLWRLDFSIEVRKRLFQHYPRYAGTKTLVISTISMAGMHSPSPEGASEFAIRFVDLNVRSTNHLYVYWPT